MLDRWRRRDDRVEPRSHGRAEGGCAAMAATVLLVEDERKLRELIRSYLEGAGFTVLSTESGAEALTLAATASPDLVILDLGLPDVPGEFVASEVRAAGNTPILMLTAKAAEEDRIAGLELGADDYVTKPFSPRELVLRVQAILRRGGPAPRQGRAPHPDRVGHPGRAGHRPGPGLLAVRTDQPGAGIRVRGVRTHRRLAREEPAPQDRGGAGQPKDRPDSAGRRLPAGPHPRWLKGGPGPPP